MKNFNSVKDIILDEFPKTSYLRQSQLIPGILPFSPATLWRKVKAGEFPQPVKLSERITAWRYSDIAAWLDKLHKEAISA